MLTILNIPILIALFLIYFWSLYNLPILIIGLKKTFSSNKNLKKPIKEFPFFSILIAAKNEEKVIERLLKTLLTLEYPKEKMEVIIVEDGSKDKTREICMKYAQAHPNLIKFYHKEVSCGKPSALNFAASKAKGEIICILDADNVPSKDLLLKAAEYFQDSKIVAVQGETLSLNANETLISKIVSYEEKIWFKLFIAGKNALNLFVPLTGSCGFLRKKILDEVGGWSEDSLAEDVELAMKIIEKGYSIKYASNINSWQESVNSIKKLFKQRIRWFRGYMETFIKYSKLLRKPSKLKVDAEISLFGPFILNMCLIVYLSPIINLFNFNHFLKTVASTLTFLITLLTIMLLLISGLALYFALSPKKLRNIVWVAIIFLYWFLQLFIAFWALLLILTNRPKVWVKTEKSGNITEILPCQD